ncbi:GNAT family N-acetyltransferase [Bremerella cremea]|uniref:GNAT family N-acetyltransferase n=1 Tax=Bremerella cremea TaxID=1031537 RepID=UPI0031E69954
MEVRNALPEEYPQLWQLFYETIHTVNARDYSPQQLDAWAPAEIEMSRWEARMASIHPFVAIEGNEIAGFCDVQPDGLIDMFFVHHQWQRRGVGRMLFAEIERRAAAMKLKSLHSHVSLTARPFFEAHGFSVEEPQQVTINGQTLSNFLMRRSLNSCS